MIHKWLNLPLLGRWEELHGLASKPTEQHVLFAGDANDAVNGLYSTLTGSVCSSPGNPCPGSTFMPML